MASNSSPLLQKRLGNLKPLYAPAAPRPKGKAGDACLLEVECRFYQIVPCESLGELEQTQSSRNISISVSWASNFSI